MNLRSSNAGRSRLVWRPKKPSWPRSSSCLNMRSSDYSPLSVLFFLFNFHNFFLLIVDYLLQISVYLLNSVFFVVIAADSRKSVNILEKESDNLRTKKEEMLKRSNDKRYFQLYLCMSNYENFIPVTFWTLECSWYH